MNWLDPDLNWTDYARDNGVEGFMHFLELQKLVELAKDKDYCEVGSYRGLSAWCVAHVAAHVTAIDTFSASTNGQTQQPEQTTYKEFCRNLAPFWSKVTCLPFSSEDAAKKIPEAASWDVIFLDAMHDYQSVREDILRWWPRVRPGGVMALHDYKHTAFGGVQQAADEFFGPLDDRSHTVTLRVCHKSIDGKHWSAVAEDGSIWSSIEAMQAHGLQPFGSMMHGAQIKVNYKNKWLGRFTTEEDAARAYDLAAREYFGEFANLNFQESE